MLLVFFVNCKPTRYLSSHQALVRKATFSGISREEQESTIKFIKQKPNRKFFLALYNTFNIRKGKYKPANKIKNIGEEPVIYDTLLTVSSAKQVNEYLKEKGYFDSRVSFTTKIAKKKARVNYEVTLNKPYTIQHISLNIADSTLLRLYRAKESDKMVHEGEVYDADNLEAEQTRITGTFREQGYYLFDKQFIRFVIFDTLKNQKVNISLIIDNPDSGRHKVFHIDSIYFFAHPDPLDLWSVKKNNDTLHIIKKEIYYIDPFAKFKPRVTKNTIYFSKGHIFKQSDQAITYARLGELGIFRQIRISYTENYRDSARPMLSPHIEVTQGRKLSVSIGGETFLNGGFYGLSANVTYDDRNFLKGGELFEVKLGGGVNNTITQGNTYDRRELTAQTSIVYPSLLIPFVNTQIGKEGNLPHTRISLRYAYIYQPQYQRKEYSTFFTYQFNDTKAKFHTITPTELTVISAKLDTSVIAAFKTQGNASRLQSFTPGIIFGSAYEFEQNAYKLRLGGNFVYIDGNLELVGNSLSLVDQLIHRQKFNAGGKLFGLPYYRYVKPEIDFRWYRKIGHRSQIIFRIDPGIAYAYGKSSFNVSKTNYINSIGSIPYDRQFFVGGAGSLRAWPARQLGPGSYLRKIPPLPSNLHGKDSTNFVQSALQLRALDQTGEVKIEGNLEYRFDLTNDFFNRKLSAAAFIDYGNIWHLRNDETGQLGNFTAKTFLRQIAIGTGAGLRYDLSFFIFRFDVGVKVYDPIFINDDPWVIKYIGGRHIQQQYLDKYGDDKIGYKFFSFNFGVGFPF